MSFWDFENSIFGGRPIVLFRFVAGSTAWRYTSASRDITYNGEVYEAATIKSGNIKSTQNALKGSLELTMARTLGIASRYAGPPPENVAYITIYRLHVGDTEAMVIWQGRVTDGSLAGDEATLQCDTSRTQFRQTGLVRMGRQCRHAIYSRQCGLVASEYAVRLAGVTSDGSRTLTHSGLAGQEDGWWSGGYAELDTGERRMIVAHAGTDVTLHYALSNVGTTGLTVTFYPGCNLSISICKTKFNNLENFGGGPTIPLDNPFTGDKVA